MVLILWDKRPNPRNASERPDAQRFSFSPVGSIFDDWNDPQDILQIPQKGLLVVASDEIIVEDWIWEIFGSLGRTWILKSTY